MAYTGIGRLHLLEILESRACKAGVTPRYEHRVASLDDLASADLIVGSDGANSIVRRGREDLFGTKIEYLTNRYAWFGTRHRFEALGHSFIAADSGYFNAHHHPHAADMSTFVVEVDEKTFADCRFEEMGEGESRAVCECIFGKILAGEALISNNSIWRQFPKVSNARWSAGNCVLLGDALHTAHYSIGSGTRLAMEDAIALAKAVAAHAADIPSALASYERERKPVLAKLIEAANKSADWYEDFPRHMSLPPFEFALGYITRSGRVDMARLRQTSPHFVAAYEASKKNS
jgi:2-polyprenyl-6-methoxyphenol hydroxylase-like FAD-dependent oxidoreductase